MIKIVVGRFGETLSNSKGYIVLESEIPVNMPAGIHEVCGGVISKIPVSATHFALCCDKCGWRLTAPNEMSTYSLLDRYCNSLGGRQ